MKGRCYTMKEIGRKNVTKELTDMIFDKDHQGISVKDCVGIKLKVTRFIVYDMEDGTFHLKFFDDQENDYYTGSQVFIKDFMRLAKASGDEDFEITIEEGKSNKGRIYLTIPEAPKKESNSNKWKEMDW